LSSQTTNRALSNETLSTSPLLIPDTYEDARKRLHWLLARTDQAAERARQQLATLTHARSWEQPKLQVLGFVAVAIPGPTLGNVHKKRKKKKRMNMIMRDDIARTLSTDTVQSMQSTSLRVLHSALARSNGDTNTLEPEMQTWLFEERGFNYYTASSQTMNALVREALQFNIAHAYEQDRHGMTLLAITPTAELERIANSEQLEPFE
jgi:hypothetical protein